MCLEYVPSHALEIVPGQIIEDNGRIFAAELDADRCESLRGRCAYMMRDGSRSDECDM